MKCEHAQEFFSEYIEKSLDKPSGVALEAHLTACATCRHDLEGLRQTWGALNAVPVVEPPKDLAWRVMVQLQQERLEQMEAERRRVNPFVSWLRALTPGAAFGYATLAALLIIAGLFPQIRAAIPSTVFNPLGVAVVLPSEVDFTPGAYQDSSTGRWFYRLLVTPPKSFRGGTVTVTPKVVVNGETYDTRAQRHPLSPGQNDAVIPVPMNVAEGPVQSVAVSVEGAGAEPVKKLLSVPVITRRDAPM